MRAPPALRSALGAALLAGLVGCTCNEAPAHPQPLDTDTCGDDAVPHVLPWDDPGEPDCALPLRAWSDCGQGCPDIEQYIAGLPAGHQIDSCESPELTVVTSRSGWGGEQVHFGDDGTLLGAWVWTDTPAYCCGKRNEVLFGQFAWVCTSAWDSAE